MNPNSGIRPWQWIVGVIVIIAIIIFIIVTWGKNKTQDVTPNTANNGSQIFSQRIVIADQFPGNIVYLTSVEAAEPSFVAIYADNGGQPGALLGSTAFSSGINPGKVNLTQSTLDGRTYYAVLYKDNGDQVFNPSTDTVVKDAQGNDVIKSFKADSNLSEDKG
ncbi:MAG: hypothetical protein V4526_00260 [Patescibacteria group bacterium]